MFQFLCEFCFTHFDVFDYNVITSLYVKQKAVLEHFAIMTTYEISCFGGAVVGKFYCISSFCMTVRYFL